MEMNAITPGHDPGPGVAVTYPGTGQPYMFGGGIRQWYPVKTTTDKLALVFEHIADNDGRVELVHHVGGRDYLVCYSKPVVR
jgi:hypothetical protein